MKQETIDMIKTLAEGRDPDEFIKELLDLHIKNKKVGCHSKKPCRFLHADWCHKPKTEEQIEMGDTHQENCHWYTHGRMKDCSEYEPVLSKGPKLEPGKVMHCKKHGILSIDVWYKCQHAKKRENKKRTLKKIDSLIEEKEND